MTEPNRNDRSEIAELLSRYAWAIADKDWTTWQTLFTEDAHVDYSTAGGIIGTPADAVAWLEPTMSMFDVCISHTGNVVVDFTDATTARVRSLYKMNMRIPGEPPTYMEACGYYRDTVRLGSTGWLLANRFEHLLYLR